MFLISDLRSKFLIEAAVALAAALLVFLVGFGFRCLRRKGHDHRISTQGQYGIERPYSPRQETLLPSIQQKRKQQQEKDAIAFEQTNAATKAATAAAAATIVTATAATPTGLLPSPTLCVPRPSSNALIEDEGSPSLVSVLGSSADLGSFSRPPSAERVQEEGVVVSAELLNWRRKPEDSEKFIEEESGELSSSSLRQLSSEPFLSFELFAELCCETDEGLESCLKLLVGVPVNTMIAHLMAAANASSDNPGSMQGALLIREFLFQKITRYAHALPLPVTLDLLRLPAKLRHHDPNLITALCDRLANANEEELAQLTTLQIALAFWSIAKTHTARWDARASMGDVSGSCGAGMGGGGGGAGGARLVLGDARILDILAEAAASKLTRFQPLSIANLLWACGKLRYRNEELIGGLGQAAARQIDSFNAQNIANTYWALGSLEMSATCLTPRNLSLPSASFLLVSLSRKIPDFNSQAIANFTWACAKTQWIPASLLYAVVRRAASRVDDFKPQEIANFMWSVAKMGLSGAAETLCLFATRVVKELPLYNSQEISNAFWSLATLEVRNSNLTPSALSTPYIYGVNTNYPYGTATARTSTTYAASGIGSGAQTPQDEGRLEEMRHLTMMNNMPPSASKMVLHGTGPSSESRNSLSFHSTSAGSSSCCLQQRPPTRIGGKGELCIEERTEWLWILIEKLEHFNAQAVANLVWSCGKLQWRCLPLFEAVRSAIQRNANTYRSQNIGNILWAFAKLRLRDAEIVRMLAAIAARKLEDFNPQEIANIFWALGTLDIRDTELTPWMQGPPLGAASQAPCSPGSCRARIIGIIRRKLPTFKPQELANLVWALARLRWYDDALLADASRAVELCADRLKPQESGNLLWALAKMGFRHSALVTCIANNAARRITSHSGQNISNIYWALGTLSCTSTLLTDSSPPRQFEETLVSLIEQFGRQEILNFVWACSRLRWMNEEALTAVAQKALRHISEFKQKDLINLSFSFRKLKKFDVADLIQQLNKDLQSNNTYYNRHPYDQIRC